MSNRALQFLMIIVILGMGAILATNLITFFVHTNSEKFLKRNQVKGMATEHQGKLYTLNFTQQNEVITLLNRAITVGKESYITSQKVSFEFDQLVIYRFNEPDLIVTPVTITNQQLLFSVPEWNPEALFRETGPGGLLPLLNQTFDPQ